VAETLGDPVEEQHYLTQLGVRLREVRRRLGLSLKLVEAMTDGEFKASALGAYERAQRTISVARLQRLAAVYRMPVDRLLPADEASGDAVIDLRDGISTSDEALLRR
jgi:transcriptional regulator with XRE-family HTH domain